MLLEEKEYLSARLAMPSMRLEAERMLKMTTLGVGKGQSFGSLVEGIWGIGRTGCR